MAGPQNVSSVDAAKRALDEYYRAFSTLDLQTVLPYFHEPCQLIAAQGVMAAPSRTDLATAITPAIEGLRARGYGRSDLALRSIQALNENTVLAIGVAIRFKLDGQELERAGVTYVLHHSGDAWRIATMILHDPGEAE